MAFFITASKLLPSNCICKMQPHNFFNHRLYHYFFYCEHNEITWLSPFPLITDKSLSDIDFSIESIKNIITKLDSNEDYGYDMVSIRMLKLCDNSIYLQILSDARNFPVRKEKKANVVPIHKKMKNSILKITYLFLFSQSVAKF